MPVMKLHARQSRSSPTRDGARTPNAVRSRGLWTVAKPCVRGPSVEAASAAEDLGMIAAMVRPFALGLALLFACTRTGSDSPPAGDGAAANERFAPGDRAAVREAVKAATGEDLGEEICAEWPSTFPRLVLVGDFADDLGCTYEGMFVDRTWHGRNDHRRTQAGLATVGWAEADTDARQRLAKAWVNEIAHAFDGTFVSAETTAFELEDTPAFEPPRVAATDENGVIVSGWVAEPSGMVWEESYHFAEYRFGPDGSLDASIGRHFTVPGERIQKAETPAPAGGG